MKRIHIILLVIFLFQLLNCSQLSLSQEKLSSKEDDSSVLSLLFGLRMQRITLSGQSKSQMRNASATVYPLKLDGSCDTSRRLGYNLTDGEGKYEVSFQRTGGSVCLIIGPDSRGITRILDEKSGTEIPLAASSTYTQTNVFNESEIPSSLKKNTNVSPFSSMASRRLFGRAGSNGFSTQKELESSLLASSKEVVIRFGLNRSFSGKSLSKATSTINDSDYPGLNDLAIDFQNTASGVTQNFNLLQAGLSTLASLNKSGSSLSSEDLKTVNSALLEDFSDGKTDGLNSGTQVKIGTTSLSGNPISCGGDPSSASVRNTCVMGGVFSYAESGGELPGGVKLDTSAIKAKAQEMVAAETATIISSSASSQGLSISDTTLSLSSKTATSVSLSWNAATGSSVTYSVYYNTGTAFSSLSDVTTSSTLAISGLTSTAYSVSGLTASQSYNFYVIASGSSDQKLYNSIATTTYQNTTPTVSNSRILLTSIGSSTVSLSWTAASDTSTDGQNLLYSLYYSTSSAMSTVSEIETNGTVALSFSSGTTSHTITGLTNGTAYYFNAIVSNSAGNKAVYTKRKFMPSESVYLYYSFDGDYTNKTSISGMDLSAFSTTYTTDHEGISNGAVSFNGTNSYLSLSSFNPSLTNGYTVFVRFKYITLNSHSRLMDFGLGEANNNIIIDNDTTTNNLGYYNTVAGESAMATGFISTGTWQTVTVVQTAAGNVVIYKDGISVLNSSITLPATMNRTSNFIGRSNWSVDSYLNGQIAEWHFYTKPLTSAEVSALNQ